LSSDRAGHDRRYAIDARKLAQELAWQPIPKPLKVAFAKSSAMVFRAIPTGHKKLLVVNIGNAGLANTMEFKSWTQF
jgi:hypothetical protein